MKLINLMEIFDHNVELEWQQNGRYELSKFIVGDGEFQLQIERRPIPYNIAEFNGTKVGEVSFGRKNMDSDESGCTTHTTSANPTKIYGAVVNGLVEKFKEYDVFFFDVMRRHSETEDEYSSKMRVYDALATRVKKYQKCWYYESPSNDTSKMTFIISKIRMSDEESKRTGFINPLKEAMFVTGMHEGCGWYNEL